MPATKPKRVLLVTYDLKDEVDSERARLFFEMLKTKGQWMHYIDSTWFIATIDSPVEMRTAIEPFKDIVQRFLVMEASQHYSGWMPREAWEWLRKQFIEITTGRLPGM